MRAPLIWLLVCCPVLAAAEPRSRARSVEILERDEPIWSEPRAGAERRGAAFRGARLPVYATARGAGCRGEWLWVGRDAWLCSDRGRLSALAPAGANADTGRHFFVGPHGSLGYRSLRTAEEGPPDAEYDPGFAVSLVATRDKLPGRSFGLSSRGFWIPLDDLSPALDPEPNGRKLDGTLDVGWIVRDQAALFAGPGKQRTGTLPRFASFDVLERRTWHGRRYYRIGEREWVAATDTRVAEPSTPPAGLGPDERWIDVDTGRQILVAYAGKVPVFAALVSTGKGPPSGPFATPKGEFRIWVKLRSSDMTNVEDQDANGYYAIEDVPWVMFFHKGYGLHGAFWHRGFGHVRSHGCVNLTPGDARWLFEWAGPPLPAGWSAVLPTSDEPGTLVRVR